MATRLYFHAANSTVGGTLPTAEQSSLTATHNIDAQTVNRSMDTTIGTSQTILTQTGTAASARTYYFTKFVSTPLNQTSVAANTWTYNIASMQNNTQNNFPVTSTNKSVWVNCYVWRPSNGTKVGTILDGNTAATVDEPSASTETVHHVTFSGSSVTCQVDDVIILEVWFQVLSSGTSGTRTCNIYFDGTVENTTDNAGVSNHASFLETPETISFVGATQYNRAPEAETITISESSLTKALSFARLPSTDTSTVTDSSLTRTTQIPRVPSTDSITISEVSLTGAIIKVGIPEQDTTTITDSSLTRLLSGVRVPDAETILSNESTSRTSQAFRNPSTDTITVNESLSGGKLVERDPSIDTVTIADSSLTRLLSSLRVPTSDDITIGEDLERILSAIRSPSLDSIDVLDSSTTRLITGVRVPSQDTITLGETLNASKTSGGGGQFDRTVNDSVTILEISLIPQLSLIRALLDILDISEVLSPVLNSRSLLETIDSVDFSLNRGVLLTRALEIESVAVGESIFYSGTFPMGSMTYATPAEVRPLLGNIGSQRTDAQINLAIDAAYDEINTKTNRIPPNEWKDSDHNFGIIQKLTRYIAAKEMSIGIKDYDSKPLDLEIEHMFNDLLQYDTTSDATQDIVISSAPETYAASASGIIWSTRYTNLKKGSSGTEGDTTINTDT